MDSIPHWVHAPAYVVLGKLAFDEWRRRSSERETKRLTHDGLYPTWGEMQFRMTERERCLGIIFRKRREAIDRPGMSARTALAEVADRIKDE